MGNLCCGGDDYDAQPQSKIAGVAPPPKVMTPTDDERREQARKAAEERARQNAVRGTQRTEPKKTPKYKTAENTTNTYSGPDISDWT